MHNAAITTQQIIGQIKTVPLVNSLNGSLLFSESVWNRDRIKK